MIFLDPINSPFDNDGRDGFLQLLVRTLQDLLLYSFILDILILVLLIAILVIIFNRYIFKYNLAFIESIINKYMPIKFRKWFNINKGIDFNNKLVLFIFVYRAHLFLFFGACFRTQN